MKKVQKGLLITTSNEVIWPKKNLTFMHSLWKYSLGTIKFGHSFEILVSIQPSRDIEPIVTFMSGMTIRTLLIDF